MTDPTIRILEPGDEALLEAFLIPRIDSSMFLLGNMRAAGLEEEGQLYGGTYAARIEHGRITGVAAHYWNGNIVFQAPGNEIELARAAVRASCRGFSGLVGPADQVTVARTAFDIRPSNIRMDGTEKLYSLELADLIIPESLANGRVVGRRIRRDDFELLLEWRMDYEVNTIYADPTPEFREKVAAFLKRACEKGTMWILEHDGLRVSSTAFNAETAEYVQVGGVYTPPKLRSRGYARAIVAQSLLDARAEGAKRGVLFTGIDNESAQRAYESLGFAHVGNYAILLLREPVSGLT